MIRCKFMATILAAFAIVAVMGTAAMADSSRNNHKGEAELKSGFIIKGKVNCNNDEVDYYKLKGQEGSNPRFILTGSDYVQVYVYDDANLKGGFKKTKSGKKFKIRGTCYLKVVAKPKSSKNKSVGGGEYKITIKTR